jgi:hypothetical protein
MDFEITNGGHNIWAKDLSLMMHCAIRAHMDCKQPDGVLNIETHLYNVVLEAHSCDYSLDVGKNLWLNKQRWSRLIKEYLPLEPWERFKGQCVEILTQGARIGATANMLFRDPDRYAKKHRWGGCLMGATFRGDNKKSGPATLTFYSRTTYIGYMGLLDAAIAAVMAQSIANGVVSLTASDIGFRWHISSSQLHSFKTLPYIYSQPDLMQRLERLERNRKLIDRAKIPPTWYHVAKWYCKVVDGWHVALTESDDDVGTACVNFLGAEKYGPFKRIKRRWLECKGHLNKHVPPSLPVAELDFEKAI